MFHHRNEQAQTFLFTDKDFKGDANVDWLAAGSGDAYIYSHQGLYFYNQSQQTCKRIDTSESVENKSELKTILNSPVLADRGSRKLQESEVVRIAELTEKACVFRGIMDTDHYDCCYKLAILLLAKESLFENLQTISNYICPSSVRIIVMIEGNQSPYAQFIGGYLDASLADRPALRRKMQGLLAEEHVPKYERLVTLIRELFANKSPVEICEYLSAFCKQKFNDAVTAEQWDIKREEFLAREIDKSY